MGRNNSNYGIGSEVVFDEDPEDFLVLIDVLSESEVDIDAADGQHQIQPDFASFFGFGLVLATFE